MTTLRHRLLLAASLVLMASPAHARWCHPIDNTARILASLNPNDIHRDWRGENTIGTAWAVSFGRQITADGIPYIMGSLYSPRGGLVTQNVYILRREWKCD